MTNGTQIKLAEQTIARIRKDGYTYEIRPTEYSAFVFETSPNGQLTNIWNATGMVLIGRSAR